MTDPASIAAKNRHRNSVSAQHILDAMRSTRHLQHYRLSTALCSNLKGVINNASINLPSTIVNVNL